MTRFPSFARPSLHIRPSARTWLRLLYLSLLLPQWQAHGQTLPWENGGSSQCGVTMSCGGGTGTGTGTGTGVPGGGGMCAVNPNGNTCGSATGTASISGQGGLNVGAGNPINLISGNKYQQEVDLPGLPGTLGIEIVRHYNSQSRERGQLGASWKLSYETDLYADAATVQIIQADGRRLIFSRDARHPSLCQSSHATDGRIDIRRNAAGHEEFVWTWNNGRKLSFNEQGKLDAIVTQDGQTLTLQRGPKGELLKVTDPQHRSLVMHYGTNKDGWRGIVAIDTPVGRFAYAQTAQGPGAGNLAQVVYPDGKTVRRYHYTDTEKQTEREDGNDIAYLHPNPHLLTGITVQGQGSDGKPMNQRITTWAYDHGGRAILSTHADGVEKVTLDYSRGGRTVLTNSLHQTTVYRHAIVDGEYRLLEAIGPGCASCGQTNMRYRWSDAGQLLMETTLAPGDGTKPLVSVGYEYDKLGRLMKQSRRTYDAKARATPWQWQARYEYEGTSSQPNLITRPSVVTGKEAVTKIVYNDHGQTTALTESGWSPAVDGNGKAEPIERTTTYRYQSINGKSLLAEIDGPLKNGPKSSPEDSDITRLEWDAKGIVVTGIETPGARKTTFQLDDAGRIIHSIAADGAHRIQTDSTYSGVSRSTNLPSRIIETAWVVDAGGGRRGVLTRVLDQERNAIGELTRVVLGTESMDKSGIDAMRIASGDASLPAGQSSDYGHLIERDMWSRPIAWRNTDGARILEAGWGEPGTVAQTTILTLQVNGKLAHRVMDDFGRIVAIKNPDQGWQIARHDEAGRIVETRDPRGAVQRAEWDAAGRLVWLQRLAPGSRTPEQVLRWTYAGPWTSEETIKDVDGTRTTRIDRNARGQVLREALYIESAGVLAATMTHPIEISQMYQYDEQGRLLARTLVDSTGKTLQIKQALDGQGQPASIATTGILPGWLGGGTTIVKHIEWQRLPFMHFATSILHGDGTLDRYDPVASSTQAHVEISGRDGLTDIGLQHRSALPRSDEEMDAAGLPAVVRTSSGEQRLRWNTAGQLIQTERAEGNSRYVYDARGRRVIKLVRDAQGRATTSISLYEDNRLIAEADNEGRATWAYVHLGYRPVAQIVLKNDSWQGKLSAWLFGAPGRHLHTAGAGRVTSMTDSGQVAWQDEAIVPTGRVLQVAHISTRAVHQPLRYVGQYHDDDSGLDYHGARYFDAASGRFISPDPRGVDDAVNEVAAPALLDLYAYAGGRPDDFFDPDGAARIRYFAITTGANGQALGNTQGFTKARWAFIVDNIQSGLAITPLGKKRNEYAQNGTSLLIDPNGDFLTKGQSSVIWSGNDGITDLFFEHYGNNLATLSQFTVNMSDDDAASLIASYIPTDRQQVFGNTCPARALLLPQIKFAPGEANINPTKADANGTNRSRILNCTVIPPFLKRPESRDYAAMANFCFGVMPPSAMLGRS
jgi:RHS repeat-associated protein